MGKFMAMILLRIGSKFKKEEERIITEKAIIFTEAVTL